MTSRVKLEAEMTLSDKLLPYRYIEGLHTRGAKGYRVVETTDERRKREAWTFINDIQVVILKLILKRGKR